MKQQTKLGLELFVIHGLVGGGAEGERFGGVGASLLTYTIKASFAKRKCSSLFCFALFFWVGGGDKRLRGCVFDGRCECFFHKSGFGYRVCHNKGHFCHPDRHCDIGICCR